MWEKAHQVITQNVTIEQLWRVWSDINHWGEWQPGLDYAKLEGKFEAGNHFLLKPKGKSPVKIELVEVEPHQSFTDLTRLPLAKMLGHHQFKQIGTGIEITSSIRLNGPLAFLWRRILGEKIADKMPAQTEQLIKRASDV
ncbi:SRPBCC family protein [Hydrogenovibrio sp. JE_KL2]|uniref:SRPBCC family protein n=1 Tax=Hydrogenovibrio sp. JE_KL2 TaxID=2651188 RepID=UPI00128D7CF2|nr:SRPBCC family protein [Hydrogenovibrio sp. JE_KL2]MPQ76102.1 polyketide cyclase [Hydrogenovibrio sp. JE_KL2]